MRSFPWDSIATGFGDDGLPVYDRSYSAEDLRSVYSTFIKDGVFMDSGDEFAVSAAGGMAVSVASGKCCINGTVGEQEEEVTVSLAASSSLDRIDSIVLRWDSSAAARSITVEAKAGTPASTPVAPALTRSSEVYELQLAEVLVKANASSVSDLNIYDTRLDTGKCGAASPFMEFDTDSIFGQLNSATETAVELSKNALDGTTAGHLQNQVNDAWGLNGLYSTEVDTLDQNFAGNYYVPQEKSAAALAQFPELPQPSRPVCLALKVFTIDNSSSNIVLKLYIPGYGEWTNERPAITEWGQWYCSEGVASVVETGTETGPSDVEWNYFEVGGNLTIMTGNIPVKSYAITTESGSLFRTDYMDVTLPFDMSNARFSVTGTVVNGSYEALAYPTSANSVKYALRHPVKVASVNAYVVLTVIGKRA